MYTLVDLGYIYMFKKCVIYEMGCLTLTLEILFFFFFKVSTSMVQCDFFYNQWSHLVKNNLGNFNLGNLGN